MFDVLALYSDEKVKTTRDQANLSNFLLLNSVDSVIFQF